MIGSKPIETHMNKRGKPSIVNWQGLLCGSSRRVRIMAFAIIAFSSAALSFMQLGFVGVGVSGDYAGYGILLLAPIVFGGLLLGVWPGTLLGMISGGVFYLHSQVQPLDYFELNYITPMSSVVLFTVAAFFLSLFLAVALRNNPPTWRRILYIAVVCLFVSFMFSLTFLVNVLFGVAFQMVMLAEELGVQYDDQTVQYYALAQTSQMGSFSLQMWIDAALMFVICIVGDIAAREILAAKGNFSLRTTFRAWLLLVVSLAFMVTAGIGFFVITDQAKDAAKQDMQDEIGYIINQLKAADVRAENLSGLLHVDAAALGSANGDDIDRLADSYAFDNLLEGYSKEADGTIVVFGGDTVILSDDPEFEVGTAVGDIIGMPMLGESSLDELASSGRMLEIIYNESMLVAEDAQSVESFATSSVSARIAYVCFGKYDSYTVMMLVPSAKVFEGRTATMIWTSLSAFVLLLAVFVMVSRLLSDVVVRRIDETNAVLGEITDGNLDARVDVRGNREFSSLSEGVNTTVDALKASIAEAESRMDAELATAKEIQESALPRIFPPYPDIAKFDVYASMNAAREVGGDFYDFFLIGNDADSDSGKLAFVVADVSGKGVPAALFMMKAKTQIRDYLASGMEVGEAVENANRQLCDGNDAGMFVTAWVGVLDYGARHVEFVNAGHNPPLFWSEDEGWRWLEERSGLPLGLFDGFPYEPYSLECKVGDQFLLYSDGVTEAMNASGELYGEARLEELVNENYTKHPHALVDAVKRGVAAHAAGAEQSDDITVLALEVGVPPEVTSTLVVPADVGELPRVNEFIHSELDRRLCPLRAQNQLDIAVEELFVNVCHYAYPDATSERPGMVRVSYTYSADPPSVRVDIADDGIPYNPLAKPDAVTPDDIMEVPIGGLGILMAKKSVDDMTYERVDGSNVVSIKKCW